MALPPSHIVVSSSPAIYSQVQTFPQASIVQSNQTMVHVPVSGLAQGGLVTTVVRPIQSVITPASSIVTSAAQTVTAIPQTTAKVNNTQVVSVPMTQVQPPSRPIVATPSNPAAISATGAAAIGGKTEDIKTPMLSKQIVASTATSAQRGNDNVVSVSKLEDLVKEVDTMQQIDDEVENVLFTLADDFIDNVVNASCLVAKNRKSSVLETKDVAIVLERQHGLYIPGFGGEDLHTYKKTTTAEAHKQRVALVRKTLKKF